MDKGLQKKNLQNSSVASFLKDVKNSPIVTGSASGRLVFAMDATASRQLTWDQASHIQTEMFLATSKMGGLLVQLAFFRGFGEFKISQWTNNGEGLKSLMRSVSCAAGTTQIGKVLQHAVNETRKQKINAVVFVGDSMEEDVSKITKKAGQLGVYGVPVFMFQEGNDPITNYAFNEIARLSGGACISFDGNSVRHLRDLLRAVAIFAAGGERELRALASKEGEKIKLLTKQVLKG